MYPTTADEREIYEQEVRYFRLVDEGRFDEAARLFSGAVARTPEGTWEGEGGARAAFDGVILHDGMPRTKHLLSTCDIQISDDGRHASALVYVLILQATAHFRLQLVRATRFSDTFVNDGQGWYLVERDETVGRRDGDLSQHLRGTENSS
jgi:hypothetical protein